MSKWYPCIYCEEDLHCAKFSDDKCESFCVLGPCTYETPSNGDRIRNMSDDELADEFIRIYNELPKYTDSWAWLREWLKQEAEE